MAPCQIFTSLSLPHHHDPAIAPASPRSNMLARRSPDGRKPAGKRPYGVVATPGKGPRGAQYRPSSDELADPGPAQALELGAGTGENLSLRKMWWSFHPWTRIVGVVPQGRAQFVNRERKYLNCELNWTEDREPLADFKRIAQLLLFQCTVWPTIWDIYQINWTVVVILEVASFRNGVWAYNEVGRGIRAVIEARIRNRLTAIQPCLRKFMAQEVEDRPGWDSVGDVLQKTPSIWFCLRSRNLATGVSRGGIKYAACAGRSSRVVLCEQDINILNFIRWVPCPFGALAPDGHGT
ncbi:hypothetical protein B0H10DRAFT_1952885 [Mycena sp. CBHHK59/15]|nr:hypothetical protein B0H10DRAFT_1964632 [Mycena sp. CBHHK59/15]KAJ6611669.1 hypothetical protein B0H10DRAFT_1952885 [Mycena sp. CBHHK59/15]